MNSTHQHFGAVEDFLSRQHRIAPDRRKAFRSRLTHLRSLRAWDAGSPGNGARSLYDKTTVVRMHIALHLAQLGLAPMRITMAINAARGAIERALIAEDHNGGADLWANIVVMGLGNHADVEELEVFVGTLDETFATIKAVEGVDGMCLVTPFTLINLSLLVRECAQLFDTARKAA